MEVDLDDDESNLQRIEDFDTWLRNNALPEDLTGSSSVSNRALETERVSKEADYQQKIHEKIFGDSEAKEKAKEQEKDELLKSWENVSVDFVAADGLLEGVLLMEIASSCDAVFAWALTRHSFPVKNSPNGNPQFTIDRFPISSVQDFVELSAGRTSLDNVSPDSIVDSCQIAHFLQNNPLLWEIVGILSESIDNENCLSICQLADHLNLPTLFEKSLAHMMQSIGDLQKDKSTWDDLTPELRERVDAIQSAIQTSIHSKSRLYFTSLDEYISIFAERVQYYRERLAQAKEEALDAEPGTKYYRDIYGKIDKQELRVKTLSLVLQEQKKLFAKKSNPIRN